MKRASILPHTLMLCCSLGHRDDFLNLFIFLISSFRRVLNIVCFLLGNSPASDLYMPTFRNTDYTIVLFHPDRNYIPPPSTTCSCTLNRPPPATYFLLVPVFSGPTCFQYKLNLPLHPSITSHLPMKMEQIECSETLAYINQTPGNYPKENTLYFLAYLSIILHTWKFLIIQIHLQARRLNNYRFMNLEMLSVWLPSTIHSSLRDNMKINICVRQSIPHP